VSPTLIHVPALSSTLGQDFLTRSSPVLAETIANVIIPHSTPMQTCLIFNSSSRDTALNNHRIHTALHNFRPHPLTGALDLVFLELPLKIDRSP
jgi:hypothetical protein